MSGIDLQGVFFGSQKSGMFGCGGSTTVGIAKDVAEETAKVDVPQDAQGEGGVPFLDAYNVPEVKDVEEETAPIIDEETWKINMGPTSMKIADLDGDGKREIIVAKLDWTTPHNTMTEDATNLTVLRYDGSTYPGWPKTIKKQDENCKAIEWGGAIQVVDCRPAGPNSIAIGDINGDGKKEIVYATNSSASGEELARVWALDINGDVLPGWPTNEVKEYSLPFYGQNFNKLYLSLSDFDADGKDEVLLTTGMGMHLWDDDGQLVSGWPKLAFMNTYPVLTDVDKDGKPEIVQIWGESAYTSKLHAWKMDGSDTPGFELAAASSFNSTLMAGDIDTDGNVEIVQGNISTASEGSVRVFSNQGKQTSSFNIPKGEDALLIPVFKTALGNLDDDQDLELVIKRNIGSFSWGSGNSEIYLYKLNGNVIPGWPVNAKGYFFDQVVASVYGPSNQVFASRGIYLEGPIDSVINVYDMGGNTIKKFSLEPYYSSAPRFLTVTDLKGNGDAEVVVYVQSQSVWGPSYLFAWNTGMPFDVNKPAWPMEGHDLKNTNCYETPIE